MRPFRLVITEVPVQGMVWERMTDTHVIASQRFLVDPAGPGPLRVDPATPRARRRSPTLARVLIPRAFHVERDSLRKPRDGSLTGGVGTAPVSGRGPSWWAGRPGTPNLNVDTLTPDEGAAVVKRIALAAGVAVAAALALTSCVRLVQNGFDDKHSVSDQVTEVRLQNGSGDVTVRSKDGATETEIRRRVEYPKDTDKPGGVSHRMEGSTLVLDGCGSRCSVDYEVTVPSKDVRITGRNSSGDVLLEGVASVEVEIGSGDATVRDVAGVRQHRQRLGRPGRDRRRRRLRRPRSAPATPGWRTCAAG